VAEKETQIWVSSKCPRPRVSLVLSLFRSVCPPGGSFVLGFGKKKKDLDFFKKEKKFFEESENEGFWSLLIQ